MSSILKFLRENHILALIEQAISKKKSRLCLNSFEIYDIPDLLYTCSCVEHLYLHRNKISMISMHISQLMNLTTLTLDYNNLTSLPPEIGSLKNLVNLNLSYNPLTELIPEIGDLENLEAFWCNRIGLREIPKEIGKLEKLDTFGARGNQIKVVPDEFSQLTKLRWLTLEHNEIEKVPEDMDKMEALVHCNIRYNNLKEFPKSLLKCPEIMYIQLSNNEISSLPEEMLSIMPPSLESIDLRLNPICELDHPEHHQIRFVEQTPLVELSSRSAASALVVNATALRLPAAPVAARHDLPRIADIEMDNSSMESSEDWENSVNSSELDVQYQSDEERIDNEYDEEALGLELTRFQGSKLKMKLVPQSVEDSG